MDEVGIATPEVPETNETCMVNAVDHRDALVAYARWRCGNSADAEDVVQDVYVKLMRQPCTKIAPPKRKGWLFTTCRNHTLNLMRRWKYSVGFNQDEWEKMFYDIGESSADALERKERDCRLYQLVETLTPQQREVVILAFVSGLSSREIGDAIGLSVGAVNKTRHDARQALRQKYQEN